MMWHIEAKQAENISKSIGDFCHDRCYSSATYRLVDRLDKAVAPQRNTTILHLFNSGAGRRIRRPSLTGEYGELTGRTRG
jgi:hypothetical protein